MTQGPIPARLGRYRPTRILGAGAAGTVYLAQDPVLDRLVTIKVIRTSGLDPETRNDYRRRFRTEAKAAGRCAHPGIVAIHDYAEDGDTPFIVMEYVDGPTLQAALQDPELRATLDPVAIILQILDALEAAHRQQITHRDIKPGNILMTRNGRVKIADFGIARLDHVMLTQTIAMVGTPGYMAPEQAGGGDIDHRADIFATGAIFYEMLAGRPPFKGATLDATLANLLGPMIPAMETIPPAFAPLLNRALAKAPADRYASAALFAAALRYIAAGVEPEETVVAAPVAVAGAATGKGANSLSDATAAGYWGAGFLKQLEAILASYIGPIAGVQIRAAASRTSVPDELYAALGAGLTKPAERNEFMRRVAALRPSFDGPAPTVVGTSIGRTMAAAPTMIHAGAPDLSPATRQAAQAALAHYLGPIAKVLVRNAAEQASSLADFTDRLAEHLPKPEEQAAFRARLAQALDGSGRA